MICDRHNTKGICFRKIEMYNSLGQFVGQYTKSTISLQNLAGGSIS
jgi:hypothetical protein